VLAAALHSDELAQFVQKYLGDLIKEAEAMRNLLDKVAAHPEELKRIMESDADLAEWVKLLGSIGDAVKLIKRIKNVIMHALTPYKPHSAPNEKGMSNEKNRKKSQKRSERWWMHA
jgi:Mg2+ and Co2+ transporter CorA